MSLCYVSRGYPFMAVTEDGLEREILSLRPRFSDHTPVYMTGSNPFALPTEKLQAYLRVLRRLVPHFQRVSMQSRIADIAHKSDEELRELRDMGLTHLYIGTENGDDSVLALMNKGQTSAEVVEQLLRLDEAGLTYTTFYILGMGGKGKGRSSGSATAAMFNQVHPQLITTTGMTVFPHTPLADMAVRGEFIEASEREKIEELQTFLSELTIDVFYDGVHYLNPLNYRFSNKDAEARRRVLEDIDDVLRSCSDEELEAMVSRRFKTSL
ncbi:radical SAM protein [uncultured Mailhella sp.]|uniref:radical SAM protein n=1 Tax=uncultured Mailhella sp. TaxID=1981031 RepID=UPI0025E5BEF3|nr:radical SAM protein [uncultured Mailhella sp.]